MDWHDVKILYAKELRSALRETSIVVNSVLLPIFLYPVMLWLMFSGITFVEGLAEGFTSRIVVVGQAAGAEAAVDSLAASDEVELVEGVAGVDEAEAALREGDVDAVLEIVPAEGAAAALPGNFTARVRYDRSVERSRRALARVEGIVEHRADAWLAAEGERLGIGGAMRSGFEVSRRDVASERDRGAFLLAQMVPLFLVVMVALGCFIPSVDTTAGERERSTWETTVTLAASRQSVVTAKYLYVATLGIMAGFLNVVAVMLSVGSFMKPLLAQAGDSFTFAIPWTAMPVLMLGAVLLALLFSAAMMLLASFARTFKDGQSMVTPVYWLVFIPLLMGDQTDQHLDPTRASIPLVNVTIMMKDAILGVFHWPWIGLTTALSLVLVAAVLWVARRVLAFEDFLLGSHDGSFWRFAKERLIK